MKATINTYSEKLAMIEYYCGITCADYWLLMLEAGFVYVNGYGNSGILYTASDTFWTWFENKFNETAGEFCNALEGNEALKAESEEYLCRMFVRYTQITPDEFYPHTPLHKIMVNEIMQSKLL